LYIYVPNPLFQALSTTAVIFFDLHKAPAQFGGATNIIPKLHPRHYKTSAVTSELAAKTIRQSFNSAGLSFGAQIAEIRLYLNSTAVSRFAWNQEITTSFPPGSD
jgi:hypothetical protein